MSPPVARKILVVDGSTRDGRKGLRVAKMVADKLVEVGLKPALIGGLKSE